MAFAPFLHGIRGPIIRPPSVGAQQPQPGGFGGLQGPIQPQQPGVGGFSQQPLGGLGMQSPIQQQQPQIGSQLPQPLRGQVQPMQGVQAPYQMQQPGIGGDRGAIASFDNLKHVHTIKKSGLSRLKKEEKVVPLASLAHA